MKAVLSRRHVGKVLVHKIDEVGVIQVAGGRYDQVPWNEPLPIQIEDDWLLESSHRFFGSEYRFAQRVIFPEILREDLVHEVVGIILVHLDLFEDDAALANDVLNGEDGIQHQIRENIKSDRQVFVEHFYVETNTFLRGESVQVSPDGINLARDGLGGPVVRPLEDHVLDEMGQAVPLRFFVPRSRLDPD